MEIKKKKKKKRSEPRPGKKNNNKNVFYKPSSTLDIVSKPLI
jgi:hypothetical protein